jgi:transposase-like protein
LEDDANKKQCLLVLMGATADGQKELIAVLDGYRGSEQSWSELLLDLKQRGLVIAPKVAVGDGALGSWAALRKLFPDDRATIDCAPKGAQLQAASLQSLHNRALAMNATMKGLLVRHEPENQTQGNHTA